MAKSLDRILDELLVLKCQEGDVEALGQLVERWQAKLLRHAWYLVQNVEASRDVVQDAWLDIVRTIGRLKEPASFRGWAFRIVGNKAADWIRTKKRRRDLKRAVADTQRCRNVSVDVHQGEDSVRLRIRQGIARLPPGCQQVLSMKYLELMSVREIAASLDVPVGTVKSRLHYAREQLKRRLQRSDL